MICVCAAFNIFIFIYQYFITIFNEILININKIIFNIFYLTILLNPGYFFIGV